MLCVECRVKASSGKTPDDIAKVVNNLHPDLTSSYNTGKADFYPSTSGKQNAAQHIVDKFGSNLKDAFLLCDDDNDMGKHTSTNVLKQAEAYVDNQCMLPSDMYHRNSLFVVHTVLLAASCLHYCCSVPCYIAALLHFHMHATHLYQSCCVHALTSPKQHGTGDGGMCLIVSKCVQCLLIYYIFRAYLHECIGVYCESLVLAKLSCVCHTQGHATFAQSQEHPQTSTACSLSHYLPSTQCLPAAELATVVGQAFLLSITSDSVQQTVTANPDKFFVSKKEGIIATEEILEHIEDHIGTFLSG